MMDSLTTLHYGWNDEIGLLGTLMVMIMTLIFFLTFLIFSAIIQIKQKIYLFVVLHCLFKSLMVITATCNNDSRYSVLWKEKNIYNDICP